jgi:hypothetical protein
MYPAPSIKEHQEPFSDLWTAARCEGCDALVHESAVNEQGLCHDCENGENGQEEE